MAPAEKRLSFVWMAVGALAFALVATGAWYLFTRASAPGYVQLTASPWAEVSDVKQEGGKRFAITGQTPLQMELPPGNYVIELRNADATAKVKVKVEAWKVQAVHYTFPQKKTEAMVEEVLRQY